MSKTNIIKLLVVVCLAIVTTLSVVGAQQTPPQQPGGGPPSGPPPAAKNLVVLKGMEHPQLIQLMREWSASLGVECSFCHQAPFETDTPRKHVARLMQRDYVTGMKHKDGSAVSCKDCHEGQPNPLRTRPFMNALGKASAGLQVLTRENLMPTMQEFTKALGVKCDYCHVQGKMSEETPHKQLARFMLTEFSGKLAKSDGTATSCNDCHQGHAHPLTHLPFPRREQRPGPPPQPAPPGEKKPNN